MKKIEIFSVGCPICEGFLESLRERACPCCEVKVLDMGDPEVAARAKALGIRSVPAVVIDGKLADCCVSGGPDPEVLRSLGLGRGVSER